MEAANLPTFLKFVNIQKSDIFAKLLFEKIMGGHETEGPGAKLEGLCPPGPGLKPPLDAVNTGYCDRFHRNVVRPSTCADSIGAISRNEMPLYIGTLL